MRTFAGGATRNDDGKKNDYRGFLSPIAIRAFGNYMTEHRIQKDGSVREPDNWKKGIPRKAYLSSIKRHVEDLHLIMEDHVAINPDTGDPVTLQEVLCAIFFNVQGLLHEVLLGRDTGKTDTEKVLAGADDPECANLVPNIPFEPMRTGQATAWWHSFDGGDFHEAEALCFTNHKTRHVDGIGPNSALEERTIEPMHPGYKIEHRCGGKWIEAGVPPCTLETADVLHALRLHNEDFRLVSR